MNYQWTSEKTGELSDQNASTTERLALFAAKESYRGLRFGRWLAVPLFLLGVGFLHSGFTVPTNYNTPFMVGFGAVFSFGGAAAFLNSTRAANELKCGVIDHA